MWSLRSLHNPGGAAVPRDNSPAAPVLGVERLTDCRPVMGKVGKVDGFLAMPLNWADVAAHLRWPAGGLVLRPPMASQSARRRRKVCYNMYSGVGTEGRFTVRRYWVAAMQRQNGLVAAT